MEPEDPTSEPTSAESWTVRDRRGKPVSAATTPLFQPGAVLAERYELRSVLGRGGMGVVFEGYDRVLGAAVAVKIVRSEYAGDRAWAERLAREVKLARQINHPNVCRVFDFGQAEAHPFLTMELAPGGTLRGEIADGRHDARPLEQRLSDARMIVSGLAAIHAAGIIHRDLTLQNVLRMGDGSLVLSDFGLATDCSDGTSSIQGGTVAYMAPEVVCGARASVASDIWSLGLVIHECVFGVRPRWSATNKDLCRPELGRRLVPAEALVFQACRACLSRDPTRRPNHAAEVARLLSHRRAAWPFVARTHPLTGVAACVLLAAALISVASVRRRHASAPATSSDPNLVVPTGEPEDWTEQSRVLADVPGRVACMVALPDGESLRFVWGHPKRAEDVNIRTGKRMPSPLVPEAFAEGCPDTTRDGRVVFSGYTTDGNPFAFVSDHPDGRAATPVVAIDPPSILSDPVWFPDGDRFQYEIDTTHTGIYSVSAKRTTVLPGTDDAHITTFGGVTAGRTVLLPVAYDLSTEVQLFSSPFVAPAVKFRVPFFVMHVESSDGRLFCMADTLRYADSPLIVVDAITKRGGNVAGIRGQAVREAIIVNGVLVFTSLKATEALVVKGHPDVVISSGLQLATRCGRELLAIRVRKDVRSIVRLDENGKELGVLRVDGDPSSPQCAPDGRTYYYLLNQSELRRCEEGTCSTVARDVFAYSLSPDGSRVAVLTTKDPPLALIVKDSRGVDPIQVLANRENPCLPAWETNDLLWASVRVGQSVVWEQFSLPSGKRTGRTAAGQSDCADGEADPATPFWPEVRITTQLHYQVRLAPRTLGNAWPGATLGRVNPQLR